MYKWKIKNDVDLKELEKYGYKHDEYHGAYSCFFDDYTAIFIWEDSCNIYYSRKVEDQWEAESITDYQTGMIDDLIEAGLAERLSD